MTPTDFLDRFPEFRGAGDLIAVTIEEAAGRIDQAVFGSQYEAAVGHLTAHLLACSPYGRSSRLVDKDGASSYFREFEKIRRTVTPRMIVL